MGVSQPAPPEETTVIRLPRGGIYVTTPRGPVQVGVPPETIKDSMALGLPMPEIFVVPPCLFDKRRGLSLAEIEFPTYFNFFVLKRRAKLVVELEETVERLTTVFRESLFGSRVQARADEFTPGYPAELVPDFERETDHFRRGANGLCQDVPDLVDFIVMRDGQVEIDGIRIAREGDEYTISCGADLIARLPNTVDVPDRTPASVPSANLPFEPPAFGVTVLGASHGFDPRGKTTGFLLWIGHRGILIDPPVDTTEHLREQGVMSKVIDGVILTHCHADHDSGVLAKLLEEDRVRLYTTPTILASFLRKYSALSGIAEDVLRRTFSFFPVTIGAPTVINGAELFFFYTLHSIPTIGFEAFYGGKSLAFSSDTLFDPPEIRRLAEKGVIRPERRDALLEFPWHHSVVLHEAGVPPLHTPIRALAELSDEVKERLWLVHIAKKDVPVALNLKAAEVGLDNTLRIAVQDPTHASAMDLLNVFCSVDFFRDLPLARARELLMVAKKKRVPAGERIIEEGTIGREFYVIASGSVSVERGGERIKTYHAGDFFGETALVLNQARTADVIARTDVEMVTIDRHGFLYLLRGTDIPRRLVRLARAREDRSWELLTMNATLRQLSGAQKTQLQSYLEAIIVECGALLWREGDPIDAVYLVDQGEVEITRSNGEALPKPFGPGALVGDFDGVRLQRLHATTARVVAAGRVLRIDGADFSKFLAGNPGVSLLLMGAHFAE